jgi:hypothetical protein
MRRFRYRLPVMVALLLLAVAVPTAASAQAETVVTNTRFPLSASAFVPCALGGQGEAVLVSGTAHIVVVTTTDAQGQPHVIVTVNYQGLQGRGLTSGDRYVGVAAENQISNFEPLAPWVVTMAQTVQFVGQGPDNNFMVKSLLHLTVDATGKVAAFKQELQIECR